MKDLRGELWYKYRKKEENKKPKQTSKKGVLLFNYFNKKNSHKTSQQCLDSETEPQQSFLKVQNSKLSHHHSDFHWFVCPIATSVLRRLRQTERELPPSPHRYRVTSHAGVTRMYTRFRPDPLQPVQASSSPSWHSVMWALQLIKAFIGDQRQWPDHRHRHRQQIDAWWDHANEGGGVFVRNRLM